TITSDPVLLLDGHVVAGTQGCRQTFHGATKDPASPIITATEPWEGHGPYTWGTRLLWNPDTRQCDFFYIAYRHEDNYYPWGLAVSDDGLTWSKPELGIETFDGRPARNMLTGGPHPDKAVRSVVRDPRPECPPAERFKAIRFTYDGEFMSYSPDGRRWTEDPGNPLWHVPSDIIHAMWDPMRQRFVAYYKIWEVTGETPDSTQPGGWRPVTLYMPAFGHEPRPDGLTELRGPAVTFHPESQATVEPVRVLLRSGGQGKEDGGGGPLTGAWHSRRVMAWAESDDWRHWRHERVVMRHDERDRPDANIQYIFVMPYGGYYLAFLTMHDERGHFEQQFAFSQDGLAWSRPWRGNFIGLGAPGAFDSGMVLGLTDPILTETQMVFCYGGFDILHHQSLDMPWKSAIGRAMIRRDGFASWDSLPDQTGVVTTEPLTTLLPELWVNADAGGGRLLVEALDENGRVLPGFEASACRPIVEDTSCCPGCRAPVTWTPGNTATALVARPFRLRFLLDNARLFAFGFQRNKV
ncbi:MAG: hypothetical protein PHR35_23105, partial [Kiritimatiellae bacterium]|nr:hypothetical protein [Kiritimatiellia bacterium]